MKEIQPVIFPLNLGTADKVSIGISASSSQSGARISYLLSDSSVTPPKPLSQGLFTITEEQFANHGGDKVWIENYVADQLGINLI